jgi:two-component system nitrate/nitrite response regulator NarL
MTPIRIVIADSNPAIRSGLRTVLRYESDIEILGEAADGRTALSLIERLRPDVALLDHRMPGLTGVEVGRELRRAGRQTKIVFFTSEPLLSEAAVIADGEVRKGARGEEIVRVLRNVTAQL